MIKNQTTLIGEFAVSQLCLMEVLPQMNLFHVLHSLNISLVLLELSGGACSLDLI